jgi:hypothetical protein
MTIRLSPALEKRVQRAAKARGMKPSEWVEKALREYLKGVGTTQTHVSEARRRLRALAKYKKPVTDFDTAVHEARRYARQLESDNAEFIEAAAKRYSKSRD